MQMIDKFILMDAQNFVKQMPLTNLGLDASLIQTQIGEENPYLNRRAGARSRR